jgi:NAD(P)-dependent dehydrogenase (short-subunit alcohol dehydrogenase family)
MTLVGSNIIIAGGSSGIGLATARLFKQSGAKVTITGRNLDKLKAAEQAGLSAAKVDSCNNDAVNAFFSAKGSFDHLVIALGSSKGLGNFNDLSLQDLKMGFEQKYWAQLQTLKAALPFINTKGSITFITAITASARMPGTAGIASINSALEVMVPILAKELKPMRVNAVSPGVVDTPWWDFMPKAAKEESFKAFAAQTAVGKVARPEDIAQAILFVVQSDYITGNILGVDGGLY